MEGTSPETQLASLLALQGLMIQVIQVSQEALRDFGQSHNEEEYRVTWEGEGRWEAGTNRMVSCEEEGGRCRAEGKCVAPLRDLKQAWSLLNPRYLSGPGTHS